MDRLPTEIRRNATDGLTITWSGGESTTFSGETLRRNCPCAQCREKRGDGSHSKPLTTKKKRSSLAILDSSLEDEISLQQIWSIGRYAIGIEWKDGHNSGIYTFEYLRELASGTLTEATA